MAGTRVATFIWVGRAQSLRPHNARSIGARILDAMLAVLLIDTAVTLVTAIRKRDGRSPRRYSAEPAGV